jgi:RND family efflux transporter MFP subunit
LRGVVTAAPDAYALIAAQVAGRLVTVNVREGDPVKKGQIVAVVEDRPYRSAFAQASAQVAQADAVVKHNATIVAREQRLFERGISARQQLEAAMASAEHDAAALELARAALDAAKLNLERAVVKSPITGTVLRLLHHVGELVDGTPATAMVEVADPRHLEFVGSAAPDDLMVVRAGQSALARFDALRGRTFPLTVQTVSPAVDPATGVGAVRLAFAPAAAQPPFGLFGEADVDVGERKDLLFVPEGALRNPSGKRAEVVVCDAGLAHVRSIEIGIRVDGKAEVTSGLRAGEQVAIDDVLGLEDDAPIEVLP